MNTGACCGLDQDNLVMFRGFSISMLIWASIKARIFFDLVCPLSVRLG